MMPPEQATLAVPSHPFQPRFVEHRGRQVLRLDYRGLEPAGLRAALRQAGQVIAAQPAGSLRILTVLESHFDAEAVAVLRRYATENRPYVRSSAVVAAGFWAVVVTSLKLHERPDLFLFEEEAEALDWLAR
jgi:hypothetical protein